MLLTQLGHDLRRLHRVPPRVVAKPGDVDMYFNQASSAEYKTLKPIFHCNANYLASGVGVGQCPRRQNFALEIPTCWYILLLPPTPIPDANPKICVTPTPTPDASQWNICGVGPSGVGAGVGHVHFMMFMSISFASGTQCKFVFMWNMGLRDRS